MAWRRLESCEGVIGSEGETAATGVVADLEYVKKGQRRSSCPLERYSSKANILPLRRCLQVAVRNGSRIGTTGNGSPPWA